MFIRRDTRWPGIVLAVALAGAILGCAVGGEKPPGIELVGLDGNRVSVVPVDGAKATVVVFVATDCPIANYFAPEIQRIHAEYSTRGVEFFLIYPDGDETRENVAKHVADYGYAIDALLDPTHELVDYVGARMTPEVAVLSGDGELRYLGRINDLYVDFGKQRAHPTREDLKLALDAILAGTEPVIDRTDVIGCFIPDPDPRGSS